MNIARKKYKFLDNAGEMGEMIASFDWSDTSLGTPENWTQSLRTTLSLLLHSAFPMFLFWGDDLVCFYNDAFKPSLGRDGKHPMIGKKGKEGWADVWHIIGPLIEQVMTTGKPVMFKDNLVPIYRNGVMEEVYWTFSYSPAYNDEGEITGVFVICTETTETVKNLQRLGESEERFRTMAEGTEILIALADDKGNATWFNKAWSDFTGRESEDLQKLGWADLIHPDDRDRFVGIYQNALRQHGPFAGEFRIRNKQGSYSWLLARGPARFAPDGTFAGHISSSMDITDKVNAFQNVRDSDLDLRNTVLEAPIGICILDAKTLVCEIVNDVFVAIAGKPYEAIAGKHYWDTFAEVKPYYEIALSDVIKNGVSYYADEVEMRLVRNGKKELIYVTFVFAPLKNVEGQVKKVAIWVLENTTQVLARKRIEVAEQKASLAITSAQLGVYEIIYATGSMITDQRFKTIWGVSQSASRQEYISAIHPDDMANRMRAHENSLRTGQLAYQARIIWPDDSWHWVNITGTVIYDDKNTPEKLIGVVQDVTDIVLSQNKIEASEKSFRLMILQAPVAMCILRDHTHTVEIANNKMLEIWGKQAPEIIGKPLFEGLPEVKDQGIEQLLTHVFTTGETYRQDERPVNLPRNGKIELTYINFVYEPLIRTDGTVQDILAVAIDVTAQVIARRKIEEVVAERTSELAQVNISLKQSNDELAQFAYIASHDLQEPVRKITTYLQILEDSFGQIDESQQRYITKMTSAAHRMRTLIRDVLAFSELSKEKNLPEPVDLNDVAENIRSDFELLIEQKGATVQWNDLPVIDAIPIQMRQLFGNLISNALKFTRQGVQPIVSITATPAKTDEVAQFLSPRDGIDYYVIQFTDNGIGFQPEHADQIFNIFQRLHTKTEFTGTGIGLAMCKKIVQNHDGHISATAGSEGAIFHVILPAKRTL